MKMTSLKSWFNLFSLSLRHSLEARAEVSSRLGKHIKDKTANLDNSQEIQDFPKMSRLTYKRIFGILKKLLI